MNPAIPIISGGSVASAAVIMQAIRASGVVVRIDPDDHHVRVSLLKG